MPICRVRESLGDAGVGLRAAYNQRPVQRVPSNLNWRAGDGLTESVGAARGGRQMFAGIRQTA